jgi:hypothetical protein
MKKLLIITLLSLSIGALEAKGGSAGGAFAGSFMGSTLGTAVSNNGRSSGGDCDRYERQIEQYSEKNKKLERENRHIEKKIKPHRGTWESLENDFEELFDDIENEL